MDTVFHHKTICNSKRLDTIPLSISRETVKETARRAFMGIVPTKKGTLTKFLRVDKEGLSVSTKGGGERASCKTVFTACYPLCKKGMCVGRYTHIGYLHIESFWKLITSFVSRERNYVAEGQG